METTIKVTDSITVDGSDIESAVATYGAATVGEKTKIRNAVQSAIQSAVRALDLPAAQMWTAVADAVAAVATKPTVSVDFNRVIADRVMALRYAAWALESGAVLPDGIDRDDIDFSTVLEMTGEYDDIHESDTVSDNVADAGRRIAGTKITRATERGSIESHIVNAFADLPVGTRLTVAQVRTRSGAASDGAIAARVWPVKKIDGKSTPVASTLDFHALGVRPCDIDGVRGLEKVADAA